MGNNRFFPTLKSYVKILFPLVNVLQLMASRMLKGRVRWRHPTFDCVVVPSCAKKKDSTALSLQTRVRIPCGYRCICRSLLQVRAWITASYRCVRGLVMAAGAYVNHCWLQVRAWITAGCRCVRGSLLAAGAYVDHYGCRCVRLPRKLSPSSVVAE